MPNHYHLLLKQTKREGISEFIRLSSNSYAKYYNTKHKRTGPLFQGRFKAVRIQTDEQLLHVSRYIHLNPYTSSLVKTFKRLLSYPYSSLKEFANNTSGCCSKKPVLEHFENPDKYIRFVKNNADFQKSLQKIKNLSLDHSS
jgi:putative transposase